MAIRPQKDGNPLYPLPPDYPSLTEEGQRLARVNAVALRDTPEDMVYAWSFFRNYHLNHPGSYFYKNFKESPPFHYELIAFYKKHLLNAVAAPRAGAKSTVIGTELPLLEMCSPSIPGMEIVLMLAKDLFVEQRFDKFMVQLTENQRIVNDFGNLKPGFGEGMWNRHFLRLRNRVSVIGISVDGKKRGLRPDLAIIDDPEYDPESGTDQGRVSRQMHALLTRQILGMLDPGSRLYWIGTLLNRKSYLYHILKGNDPVFEEWHRKLYAAEYIDPHTKESKILWDSKWTPAYLEKKRLSMGEGAYRTEFNNDPRGDDEQILAIDGPIAGYSLKDAVDFESIPQNQDNPLESREPIEWNDIGMTSTGAIDLTPQVSTFGEQVSGLKRYMTVDYAPTTSNMSDFSAIVVWGMDRRNTLWVLDAWQKRVRPDQLVSQIWKLARKWQTSVVGVEAVSLQDEIRQQVADYMSAMQQRGEWTPRVAPIRYPAGVSKADRIAGLEWRFNKGRIKLPLYMQNGHPDFHMLFEQIASFTMDLGLLPHDDLVDTLSMAHYLLPSGSKSMDVPAKKPASVADRIISGEIYVPGTNVPLLSALSPDEYTRELEDYLSDPETRREFQRLPVGFRRNMQAGPYFEEEDFL